MSPLTESASAIWPLLAYTVAVLGMIGLMLGLSHVLGGRHQDRVTGEPYESGVKPVGDARMRYSAKFYLVAIFFVLFDLEVVFLFAWGIAATEVGWPGYAGAMVFLFILTVALVYEWRLGALDWGARPDRKRATGRLTP